MRTTTPRRETLRNTETARRPTRRPRRLRRDESIRSLVRETNVTVDDLIYPLFVVPDSRPTTEIRSMPGVWQHQVADAINAGMRARDAGIHAVLLFGLPEFKDSIGSASWDPSGPVQLAIEGIKHAVPDMTVIADVCLCEYTDHGHCGVIEEGDVDNDATLPLLAKQALSFANAGADFVAPSDMMDGRVAAIRATLDEEQLSEVGILAYSAKFASGFYGPFREAAGSTPKEGGRSMCRCRCIRRCALARRGVGAEGSIAKCSRC